MFFKKISKKEKYIIFFLILLIGILFYFYFSYQTEKFDNLINIYNPQKIDNPVNYSNRLYSNLENGRLTELMIQEEDVRRDDCDEKCGEKECTVMYEQKKNLDKCNQCHSNPKKCYRQSMTTGNCDDCLDDEVQINCNSVKNYGAPNPQSLFSENGVNPYYVIKTTFSQEQGMTQECVFSNNLVDLF